MTLNTIRQRRWHLNLNQYPKPTSYRDFNFVFVPRKAYWVFLALAMTQQEDLYHYQMELWLSGKA